MATLRQKLNNELRKQVNAKTPTVNVDNAQAENIATAMQSVVHSIATMIEHQNNQMVGLMQIVTAALEANTKAMENLKVTNNVEVTPSEVTMVSGGKSYEIEVERMDDGSLSGRITPEMDG